MTTRKENTPNRLDVISFMQTLGIMLVVTGHSFGACPYDTNWFRCYSFNMPLFMFLSGYLLYHTTAGKGKPLSSTDMLGEKGFIRKKIIRLLVPYFVLNNIALIPKLLMNGMANRPVEFTMESYLHGIVYPFDNVIQILWFLPALFIIFLVTMLCAKLPLRNAPLWLTLVATLALTLFNPLKETTFLQLESVARLLFYFTLGYVFRHYMLFEAIARNKGKILFLSIIIGTTILLLPKFFGNMTLWATNGIVLSAALAYFYTNADCKFLNHLFGATYAIYLFSWFPQVASQQILSHLISMPWQTYTILAVISGIYVPVAIYTIIKRYKSTKVGKVVAMLTGQ